MEVVNNITSTERDWKEDYRVLQDKLYSTNNQIKELRFMIDEKDKLIKTQLDTIQELTKKAGRCRDEALEYEGFKTAIELVFGGK